MTSLLKIRLLGGFALELDGKPISGLPSRKAEALIAYLVCHQRPFPRETLADLLWDDRPPDQSLANFRAILSGVRRNLKPYLHITRQTVGFNHDAPYQLDTDLFEQQCQPFLQRRDPLTPTEVVQLETAVSLYKAPLLDGFFVRESRRFEEWVFMERERLQRIAITVWQQLINSYLLMGQYAAGIEHGVRLLELDPLNEATHRQMMQLLARSGQRHAALQQYDVCRRILDSELGVPPASETTQLRDQVQASLSIARHNLPPQPTPFVGRETELAELRRLLTEPNGRLITILGPGGIGKTRFAQQAAQQIIERQPGQFLHGIRFVPLQSLSSAEFLPTTLADALDFRLRGAEPAHSQLAEFLRQRELLLILDNFEHLATDPAASQLLNTLMRHCAQLKLVITSRTRLNVPGERIFDMRGLPFPRDAVPVPAEQYGAVQLFIQTARRYLRTFQPSTEDLLAIGRTCQLLDGVPLGIELAAAWVRLLSCTEISDGIAQDLDFLQQTGDAHDAQQVSLRAAFSRSWRLLDEPTQTVLKQLSIFNGSFSREAAQTVAQAPLPQLIRLLDHSWIRRTPESESIRFDMLTVLRQFVEAYLAEEAGLQTAVRQRFVSYYATFLHERLPALEGGAQRQAYNEIGKELKNIRHAMILAVQLQLIEPIAQGLESLFHFYDTRSWFQEGTTLFQRMVAGVAQMPPSPRQQVTQAKLEARLGWFLFHLGQYEQSMGLLSGSLATLRQAQALPETAFNLNYLGAVARHLGDYETAVSHLQEALTIARTHNDAFSASIALNILGQVASLQGQYEQARQLCREGLAIKRTISDDWGITHSLTYLGRVAQAMGELAEAEELFNESRTLSKAFGDRRGVAFAQQNLGDTLLLQTDYEAAVGHYTTGLQIYREIGDRLGAAMTLAKLGQAQSWLGDEQLARRQLVEALQVALEIGSVPAMLEGVLGTAVLCQQRHDVAEAVRRLHFVAASASSTQPQKERAAHLLAQHAAVPTDGLPQSVQSATEAILQSESALIII